MEEGWERCATLFSREEDERAPNEEHPLRETIQMVIEKRGRGFNWYHRAVNDGLAYTYSYGDRGKVTVFGSEWIHSNAFKKKMRARGGLKGFEVER